MTGAYYIEPMQPFHSAAGAAFASFTAYQDISPQKPIIPAEMLDRPGAMFEIEAWGEFSNTGTPTLALGVFLGTAAVAWQMALLTTTTGATAWPWHLKFQGKVLTQGATGTVLGQGIVDLGVSLTAFAAGQAIPATAAARTVTVDVTTAKYVGVGAQWGTSSASNTLKCNMLNVLALN